MSGGVLRPNAFHSALGAGAWRLPCCARAAPATPPSRTCTPAQGRTRCCTRETGCSSLESRRSSSARKRVTEYRSESAGFPVLIRSCCGRCLPCRRRRRAFVLFFGLMLRFGEVGHRPRLFSARDVRASSGGKSTAIETVRAAGERNAPEREMRGDSRWKKSWACLLPHHSDGNRVAGMRTE